tara:strand:- start:2294 stop:2545 length:252 start_codon:yes stop_codon:yes gene_type:complete
VWFIATVADARDFDPRHPDPSHHFAFGQMTVTYQSCAAVVRFLRRIALQQNSKVGFNRLLNQTLRAGSQQTHQRIRRKPMWIG